MSATMVALLCFLTTLVSLFKSKSRLEGYQLIVLQRRVHGGRFGREALTLGPTILRALL